MNILILCFGELQAKVDERVPEYLFNNTLTDVSLFEGQLAYALMKEYRTMSTSMREMSLSVLIKKK